MLIQNKTQVNNLLDVFKKWYNIISLNKLINLKKFMKKSFFFSLALSLFGIGMLAVSASAVEVTQTVNLDGELIKGESYQTVYYLAEDGRRYVFPNSKTYFSWFDDFSEVREVTDEELFSYPLGGNVRYKPGSLLVKITTNPKVYAVGENGKLRWVKDEAMAISLYGENWNKLVDDIPDSFFTNYEIGEDADEDYDPSEVEEEYPSISHNRGFKAKKVIQNRIQNIKERQCNRLEEAVNKLQRRAAMYGMEIEGTGDDFVRECIENNQVRKNKKVKVCHMSANGKYRTLKVAPTALRGMFASRARLGECSDFSDVDEGEEDASEEMENKAEEMEDADELECAEGEENSIVDGVDTCVADIEDELECAEGEEITEVNDVDTCTVVVEEELECSEGEELTEVDGVDTCTSVEVVASSTDGLIL